MTAPGDGEVVQVVEEEAFLDKRTVGVEHVRVSTSIDEREVVVRDTVARERLEIVRIPLDREVAAAPAIREVDGVTVIPVVEERLVVEKRLFLVEEVHVRRTAEAQKVEMPTTLRRTRIDVERTDLTHDEE